MERRYALVDGYQMRQKQLLKMFGIVPLSLSVVLATGGCRSLTERGVIAPPGPMLYQQANATVHDPFLQPDIGPDDKSMRPPDYQNPLALPVRNQMKNQVAPWLLP